MVQLSDRLKLARFLANFQRRHDILFKHAQFHTLIFFSFVILSDKCHPAHKISFILRDADIKGKFWELPLDMVSVHSFFRHWSDVKFPHFRGVTIDMSLVVSDVKDLNGPGSFVLQSTPRKTQTHRAHTEKGKMWRGSPGVLLNFISQTFHLLYIYI